MRRYRFVLKFEKVSEPSIEVEVRAKYKTLAFRAAWHVIEGMWRMDYKFEDFEYHEEEVQ